jgi:hypothetical protein
MPAPEMRAALATVVLACAAAIGCSRPPRLAADLVITRAQIWTGDAAQPSATAVAVIADRIVEVGSADAIERWRGAGTTVVNAEGRRLIPGLNDARVRLVDGGTRLDDVDLTDAATPAEFARGINERARAKPGEWVLGGRWDERAWRPAALPARSLIDDITNSSPVFVVRYDGSMALANAAALGRAGITEHTPNPSGGAIVRGADGFPTGVLQGTAMEPVLRVIPAMSKDQRRHAVKRALEQAESLGITSVQDLGATADDIAVRADLANRGELTVRIYAVPAEAGWHDQAKLGVHQAFGSSCCIGAVHAVFDAAHDAADMRTRLMAADHGLQLSVDAVDAGAGAGPGSVRRHRSRQRRARSPLSPRQVAAHAGRCRAPRRVECRSGAAAGQRRCPRRRRDRRRDPSVDRLRVAGRAAQPDADAAQRGPAAAQRDRRARGAHQRRGLCRISRAREGHDRARPARRHGHPE